MQYIHTMELISAIKKDDIIKCSGKRIEIEHIIRQPRPRKTNIMCSLLFVYHSSKSLYLKIKLKITIEARELERITWEGTQEL